jgi:hypothetical protein
VSPLVARAYVLRGLTLWIGARAIGSAVVALAGGDPLHLPVAARLLMIACAVVAAAAQTLRLRERVLLGNLGVTGAEVLAWFAAAAMAGELALAGIAGLVT